MNIHYGIWLVILAFLAAFATAVYFLTKWFRAKVLFTREHWIRKVLCGLFVLGMLCLLVWFSLDMWHLNRGDVKYGGVWYGVNEHDKIPREFTEEWGVFRKQLRETPTVRGPEETYKLFREALLREDFEGAVGFVSEKKREEYGKIFEDKKKIMDWVKMLPDKIDKERNDEMTAQYSFGYVGPVGPKGEQYGGSFEFTKGMDGFWTIDGI